MSGAAPQATAPEPRQAAAPLPFDPTELPDAALAAGHLEGDDSAFAELYRRYYRRLVRLCERRFADSHLAEDVAQETLLQVLRYLNAYDTTRPLWPWLRTIALRTAHRHLREVEAERCTDMCAEDFDILRAYTPHDIDEWFLLRRALAAVPARQRAALIVRYVDDWSTSESAELHGLGVNAFEQLLWRARRRLSAEYLRLA